MNKFKEIPVESASDIFNLIGRDWMLITAASEGKINTMTASWGCAGVLWNKPVCICFIRPQRYTYGLVNEAKTLSLSFFDQKYRSALAYCGSKSGRSCDKFADTGLTPAFSDGTPYVDEAKLVMICRKLYADDIREDKFILPELLSNYPIHDFHRFFVCEIEKVLSRVQVSE